MRNKNDGVYSEIARTLFNKIDETAELYSITRLDVIKDVIEYGFERKNGD